MGIRILVLTIFSLLLVSCGKSEESAHKTDPGNEAADAQVMMNSQTPASTESVKTVAEKPADSEPLAPAAAQADKAHSGEAVYKKACMSCHLTGAANAPKLGDASAWKDRIAKGAAALVQSAIKGVPGTAMMARGTCSTCSDDDIKAAVDYMISQSR